MVPSRFFVLQKPLVLACCLSVIFWLPAPATLAGQATAASPSDELLRLVPDDVGFCLVVQDLRGHAAALLQSPFWKDFRQSAQGTALSRDPEIGKLLDVDKFLQKHLQIDWPRLRDDILGDALVLAYRPGPPSKADKDEQGLLLLRAREAGLLADLIERLNRVQKEAGDLKELSARVHKGVSYYRRVDREQTNYYYVKGPILIFTGQEAMLQRAIELDQSAIAGVEPHVTRQLRLAGAERKLAALWINPRAFEPELEWKASTSKGEEASILAKFLTCWKPLEGLVLSVDLQKDLEVSLAIRANAERLPPAARRFLTEAAQPSELWNRFPENALLAVAGRVDLPALVELVGQFLTSEARRAAGDVFGRSVGAMLGKDLVKEVLPNLGPDVGFCVVAPPAQDKAWFPQAIFALRVRAGEGESPVDQALLSAVNSYALLAVLGHNRNRPDSLSLRTVTLDKVEVKYLANDQRFPPGFQPAFALRGGYLLLATSPEAIRRFGAAAQEKSGETPLLRLSIKELRHFLQERRESLAELAAEPNQITKEEARRRLDSLYTGTEFLDRLELSRRAALGQVTLTLRIRTVKSLR